MAIVAHYLTFTRASLEGVGKVGGQPTKFPICKTWEDSENTSIGFLLELKVDPLLLPIPNAEYLQLYQRIEEGCDPMPILIIVPVGCESGSSGVCVRHPHIEEFVIGVRAEQEPVDLGNESDAVNYAQMFRSKLGGVDPWEGAVERKFLGQIGESPAGLNLGGTMCSLYLDGNGKVELEMN